MTQTKRQTNTLPQEYEAHTDKYFLRSKEILEKENINPIVRYQVFARTNGIVRGVNEAVDFIYQTVGAKAKVYALRNGQEFENGEPLMKIEGYVQDLVDLETVYLGITAGELTGFVDLDNARIEARKIVDAAKGIPVWYFGARHFDPRIDAEMGRICQSEGFVGASTDVAAAAWGAKGAGTTPHSLILSYTAHMLENKLDLNPTVETAKAFDKYMDPKVPRIMLIDTFNREIDDTLATAEALDNLAGVRIDTCGENYTQGIENVVLPELDVPEKYLTGKGVKIAGVWGLREALVKNGLEDVGLVVSSGFNVDKTRAFVKANNAFNDIYGVPLFTAIGTGSIAKPKMTTSDIVAYFSEQNEIWTPLSKKGRDETPTKRLEEVL